MKILQILIALLLVGCFQSVSYSQEGFKIYESFLFSGMPELDIKKMSSVGHPDIFWDGDINTEFPSEEKTREAAAKLPSSMEQEHYFIDIEHLPIKANDTKADWDESITKLISVITWIKSERPTLKFGFYMVIPERQYWEHSRKKQWRDRNDYFAQRLASHVDYVLPSLYTFYDDKLGWVDYAVDNISEAKKSGKPVYCFLWPQYHDSSALALQLIPGDYWRLQLETCKEYADGVVMWGGWQSDWSESTSETDVNNWWFQTIDFIDNQ